MDDYITYWMKGAGVAASRSYSEWITAAAYQRYLVTGDPRSSNPTSPSSSATTTRGARTSPRTSRSTGTGTTDSLYFQSPLSDATEYTETSFRSTDAFGGGTGFRPTINSYQYANALAMSKIATLAGDSANATTFANKATSLKAAVQHSLWDPQRQFFFHVYNNDSTNSGIAGTRTTWREAMGFAPWAFELPDAHVFHRLAVPDRPPAVRRTRRVLHVGAPHRLRGRAGHAGRRHRWHGRPTASNGQYVGHHRLR